MQTHVLLSIKPEFVEKIFSGSKRFEFRRVIFKSPNVSKIVVYASHPIKRVVGEFQVDQVLLLNKECLWKRTKAFSGIEKEYFDSYFVGKSAGYAIAIKSPVRYAKPLMLGKVSTLRRPPQSFSYLKAIAAGL